MVKRKLQVACKHVFFICNEQAFITLKPVILFGLMYVHALVVTKLVKDIILCMNTMKPYSFTIKLANNEVTITGKQVAEYSGETKPNRNPQLGIIDVRSCSNNEINQRRLDSNIILRSSANKDGRHQK